MAHRKRSREERELEEWIKSAAKSLRRMMEEERKNIPAELLQRGDSTLHSVFENVVEFLKVVGAVEGVKISDNDATLPAFVATTMVSLFSQLVIHLYSQGLDMDSATAVALGVTLSPKMAINVAAHVEAVAGGSER